jgi:hypothetical protein
MRRWWLDEQGWLVDAKANPQPQGRPLTCRLLRTVGECLICRGVRLIGDTNPTVDLGS